jgi:hypothetical protein
MFSGNVLVAELSIMGHKFFYQYIQVPFYVTPSGKEGAKIGDIYDQNKLEMVF